MNVDELKKRQERIRNFSIIAHIDHGKSTLADRILEATDTVSSREMQAQLLDSMDLERERGITIKLNAIELNYRAKNGETYIFHLIDTPGHVDFTYEVSRSLAACEGAILVVDAAQGIEAQTLANVYLALDNDLEILPVINKIDLPAADPERVRTEIEDVIGLDASEAVLASAKAGIGIEEILEQIVEKVPAPTGDVTAPLKALIFDSVYDAYRGVILQVRVMDGVVKPGDTIQLMSNGKTFDVTEVGIFTPKAVGRDFLATGDVGYIAASIKTVQDTRVGDTVTLADNPADEPLHGYKQMNPMVFAGLYPIESNKYNDSDTKLLGISPEVTQGYYPQKQAIELNVVAKDNKITIQPKDEKLTILNLLHWYRGRSEFYGGEGILQGLDKYKEFLSKQTKPMAELLKSDDYGRNWYIVTKVERIRGNEVKELSSTSVSNEDDGKLEITDNDMKAGDKYRITKTLFEKNATNIDDKLVELVTT
ncbi:MAG: GTP-binding protein, partial [Granulicatella adiacens]